MLAAAALTAADVVLSMFLLLIAGLLAQDTLTLKITLAPRN